MDPGCLAWEDNKEDLGLVTCRLQGNKCQEWPLAPVDPVWFSLTLECPNLLNNSSHNHSSNSSTRVTTQLSPPPVTP
jgi:hypothetical protein